jgi:replicative DNA helicase
MLYNEEVEQAFLGSILLNDVIYDDVSFLRPDHFYIPVNGKIFAHIKRLKEQGKEVTPHFVQQFFTNDNDLPSSHYVVDLADAVISTTGAKAHASQILAMHLRRGIKELGRKFADIADNPSIDEKPKDILAQAEQFLTEALEVDGAETIRHIGFDLEKTINDLKTNKMGISSGLKQLDDIIKGYHAGRLYVIAARPAMGKTAMGLTHAINAAQNGYKTLFFSLEMTRAEIQGRLIQRYRDNPAEIIGSELFIDDKAGLTVTDITQRCRRHKRKNGLDIVFIDYLGLIRSSDTRAQMVHQIGEITRSLKQLAKDVQVPVVLLCQLNRGVEGREDKRPTMADLRDSGAIEQDADCVMFIYREEYYLANVKPDTRYKGKEDYDHTAAVNAAKGKAELIVAKNRQGKLGTASLKFVADRQVFND